MANSIILSTDVLGGYGLDLICQTAKECGFDGLNLCTWKSFDVWNVSYVKKLLNTYNINIYSIEVSSNVNQKELNYAVELALEVGAKVISINAPQITNFKSYKFLSDYIKAYRKNYPDIKFSIINPDKSTLFMLPVPKYYFTNLSDTIKKYGFNLAFDIVNMDEMTLETIFLKKISNFLPYISMVYVSDKSKTGVGHISLGDGVLKISSIIKGFSKNGYALPYCIKINFSKKELSDVEKIKIVLTNNINYIKKYLKQED